MRNTSLWSRAEILSHLNAEREQIIRTLDDPNLNSRHLVLSGGEQQDPVITRLRNETEYAFFSALWREGAAQQYVNLTTVDAQIILFLYTASN